MLCYLSLSFGKKFKCLFSENLVTSMKNRFPIAEVTGKEPVQ